MRTINRLTRGIAALAVMGAAVLITSAPAEAGKAVYSNLTRISAYGYSAPTDTLEITVTYDTRFTGKPSASAGLIEFTITWRNAYGDVVGVPDVQSRNIFPHDTSSYLQAARPSGTSTVEVTAVMWKQTRAGLVLVDSVDSGGAHPLNSASWGSVTVEVFNVADSSDA